MILVISVGTLFEMLLIDSPANIETFLEERVIVKLELTVTTSPGIYCQVI